MPTRTPLVYARVVVAIVVVSACAPSRSRHHGFAAGPPVCGSIRPQDITRIVRLPLVSATGNQYAPTAVSCRWLLRPPGNAVFLNVVSPEPGVTVDELFNGLVGGSPGRSVTIGTRAWAETVARTSSVIVETPRHVLTVAVDGAGTPRLTSADRERQAATIARLAVQHGA